MAVLLVAARCSTGWPRSFGWKSPGQQADPGTHASSVLN